MSLDQSSINITPSPRVLVALARTPLRPVDALCELIDNGFDAVSHARLDVTVKRHYWLQVTVPGDALVRQGGGAVRVADNANGLSIDQLKKAMTAGFSGNNQWDSLGLFGMGFNIATAKLGRRTTVTTMRREDNFAIEAVLDIPTLVKAETFDVPIRQVPKPAEMDSGTIIEVSGWWPDGDQNADFIRSLAKLSKPGLRETLGRRYATLLRRTGDQHVQLLLNDEHVIPFEHCVWGPNRFVERQGWGRIPARIEFSETLNTRRVCRADGETVTPDTQKCPTCNGIDFRTINETVRGWVGIQRFDDMNNFGIDVIRNGRAILVGEQDAFFTFTDEMASKTKEYPVDGPYGRIVGEVHLDHVPVDYTKQSFERASESWIRAITFLRGQSLLEGKWQEGYKNESPIGRLFKGYRKVRRPGLDDMYMGRYDDQRMRAVRISREVEAEYYQRFKNGEPGYLDDENWWKLVEEATTPPLRNLSACPKCAFQLLDSDEVCADCGTVVKGKPCVDCGAELPNSATLCDKCGVSQVPEVVGPWTCNVCSQTNSIEDDICDRCSFMRGHPGLTDSEYLLAESHSADDLSLSSQGFKLPNGDMSEPVAVEVHDSPEGGLLPSWNSSAVPLIVHRPALGLLRVFIDRRHPTFRTGVATPEILISIEISRYLLAIHPKLLSDSNFSLASFASQVSLEAWPNQNAGDPNSLKDEARELFYVVAEKLADDPASREFFTELKTPEVTRLSERLIANGSIERLDSLIQNGGYLSYLAPTALSRYFVVSPETWFARVWKDDLTAGLDEEVRKSIQLGQLGSLQRALGDCAEFLETEYPTELLQGRARASLNYLQDRLR